MKVGFEDDSFAFELVRNLGWPPWSISSTSSACISSPVRS